jgi:hypothetical protein
MRASVCVAAEVGVWTGRTLCKKHYCLNFVHLLCGDFFSPSRRKVGTPNAAHGISHGGTLAVFPQVSPSALGENVMAQEKVAVLYANNTLDTKLEAARLMSEALSRPEDADALIAMAMMLFDTANAAQERRAG